jgi:hypothetical protein
VVIRVRALLSVLDYDPRRTPPSAAAWRTMANGGLATGAI